MSYLPLVLQFACTGAAIGFVSFAAPVTTRLISEAEGRIQIPAPSRLFVEHTGVMKAVFVGLFLVSLVAVLVTRAKMRDEVDRMIVQSAIVSIVWYLGVTALGGMVLAALLPYFALHAGSQ